MNDPSNPENKYRTRESQRQLRQLLMAWDPIGVSGVPEVADEYDCMLSPLLHQLHDGAGVDEVRDLARRLARRAFWPAGRPCPRGPVGDADQYLVDAARDGITCRTRRCELDQFCDRSRLGPELGGGREIPECPAGSGVQLMHDRGDVGGRVGGQVGFR